MVPARDFRPDDLGKALVDREVVRIVAMRATVHLLTADDALLLRPLCQPVLDGELARHRDVAPALRGVDLAPVLAYGAQLLAERPRSGTQLRAALAERFPDVSPTAMALACRNRLALVQVPPRGVWGKASQVVTTTAEAWLGRPLVANPSVDEVVLRYLAAYGPATAADVAAWSRLTGFREVLERLRPQLRTFRDERGRELFDVPDAPLPDPDTPAPARLLPEYDNAVLSHADRSRYTPDTPIVVDPPVHGSVLHDGFGAGTWSIERAKDAAVLTVRHRPLGKRAIQEVLAEAEGALDFLEGPGRRARCAPSRPETFRQPPPSSSRASATSSARAAGALELLEAEAEQQRVRGGDGGRDAAERRGHARSRRVAGTALRRAEDRPRAEAALEALGLRHAGRRGQAGVVEDDAGPAGERVGDVADDELHLLAGVGREVEGDRLPAAGVAGERVPRSRASPVGDGTGRPSVRYLDRFGCSLDEEPGLALGRHVARCSPLRSGSVVQSSWPTVCASTMTWS